MINRNKISEIINDLKLNKIQVLVWTRQVWKTTILKKIQEKIISQWEKNLYLDLEIDSNLEIFSRWNIDEIIAFLKLNWFEEWKKFFLFLDEFQLAKNITKIFKIIYDNFSDIKIIATWSSSLLINKFLKEWLTWRKIQYKIYPISYTEFAEFKDEKFSKYLSEDIKFYFSDFEKYFFEFLKFWSYPEILLKNSLDDKNKIFSSIYESYIDKDISFFVKRENTPKFKNLVKALALQIWSLVNKNELSNLLNISNKTVDSYNFVLEETFVISYISAFVWDKRKELSQMKKVYFNDLWLRNYVLNNFNIEENFWAIIENFIFTELLKSKKPEDEIKFWRTKNWTEIDFILERWWKIFPIEVKYRNNPFKAIKNIKSFIEKYSPEKVFVITKDYFWEEEYNWVKIFLFPAIRWVKGVFEKIN